MDRRRIIEFIAKRRVVNDSSEESAMRRWTTWLGVEKGIAREGADLTWLEEEDREWWVAEFLLHVYTQEGKRHEQVKAVRDNTRAGFKSRSWRYSMWESTLVENVMCSCRRTHQEVSQAVKARAEVEKYDWNLEAMEALWKKLKPDQVRWEEQPSKEEVDNVLMFLLAAFLLDMGMRVGMASHQKIGHEMGELGGRGTGSEGSMGEDLGEREYVRSHIWKNKKLRFTVVRREDPQTTEFIEGGKPMAEFLRVNENSRVIDFQVWFDTSKTVQRAMKAPVVPKWTPFGRRSPVESEVLEVFLNFIRWNGYEGGEVDVLKRCRVARSAATGRMCKGRLIRSQDLVEVCKGIAEGEGVPKSHISAISFRKGNATLMSLMCAEELKDKKEAMVVVKNRANKWSQKSKVPLRHYVTTLDNRGPLARLESWEEGRRWGTGFQGWRDRLPPS